MSSIHPRVENGKSRFAKRNTCGNSSLTVRLQKQLAGIEKHLVEHPRDGLSRNRVSTINALLAGK